MFYQIIRGFTVFNQAPFFGQIMNFRKMKSCKRKIGNVNII